MICNYRIDGKVVTVHCSGSCRESVSADTSRDRLPINFFLLTFTTMNAFRFAIRTVRPTRVVIASRALPLRSFASTPLRRASEDADSFMAAFKDTPLFTKFAEQPEAVAALSELFKIHYQPSDIFALGDVAEFLKKNGALILRLLRAPVNYLYLDIDMTIPLSSMTMFKLVSSTLYTVASQVLF